MWMCGFGDMSKRVCVCGVCLCLRGRLFACDCTLWVCLCASVYVCASLLLHECPLVPNCSDMTETLW